MNEETILEKRPVTNGQSESNKEGIAWKQVTLGGVSGILMGAGLLYAGESAAKALEADDVSVVEDPEEETPAVVAPEVGETSHTLENGLQVAAINDDLSFGEAFAQARAEVGPGGVFHWHGGIYNTYTASEWNAMTTAEKHDFAEQVQPENHPDDLSTPTDAAPQVVVVHHIHHYETPEPAVAEVHQAAEAIDTSDDVQLVEQMIAENFDIDDDVHIVGYANVEDHLAVGYDITGDDQPDVAIIDMDDNLAISGPDLVVNGAGHITTIDDLMEEAGPYQQVDMEMPDDSYDIVDYNDLVTDV